jgi:hypothetical protein
MALIPLIFLPIACEHAAKPFPALVFGFPLCAWPRVVLSPWVHPVRSPFPPRVSQVPGLGRALLGMQPRVGTLT